MRLRGYGNAIEEIRSVDPDSELTVYALRLLVRQNRVPVLHVGRRHLIDVDMLLELLESRNSIEKHSNVSEVDNKKHENVRRILV